MKKIVLSILSFLVTIILTGCNSNKPILQPEGTVIEDSNDYLMISGGYKWKEGNIEINTLSSYDLIELADTFETLDVEKKDILKFEINKKPSSIIVTKYNEDGTSDVIETKDNKLTMPSKSGYYIYEIKAKWPEGKINFVFDVNVK